MDKDKQHAGGDEPEAPAGELAQRCALCRAAIAAEFFTLRGLLLCPQCAESIRQRQRGRGNVRRALAFGAVAAGLMALLWFFATLATRWQLSWVALFAGVVIGLAVHQGAGGRGGLRYQIAAMLLVYAAFVVRYVPPVFGGIADAIKKEHETSALTEAKPAPAPNAPAPAAHGPATAAPGMPAPAARTSTLATLKAYLVFTIIAWGLVLGAPFLPGTTGLWTVLSLAAGMALAFRLNRHVPLRGPFSPAG
ncbi:MAG: hypothetical protein JXP73_17665 [Deltaproteobacteria bacterium]|nr:hypothetical protein [Deltaproteobacteria bacterium]